MLQGANAAEALQGCNVLTAVPPSRAGEHVQRAWKTPKSSRNWRPFLQLAGSAPAETLRRRAASQLGAQRLTCSWCLGVVLLSGNFQELRVHLF